MHTHNTKTSKHTHTHTYIHKHTQQHTNSLLLRQQPRLRWLGAVCCCVLLWGCVELCIACLLKQAVETIVKVGVHLSEHLRLKTVDLGGEAEIDSVVAHLGTDAAEHLGIDGLLENHLL
jgi:hypothetical protein